VGKKASNKRKRKTYMAPYLQRYQCFLSPPDTQCKKKNTRPGWAASIISNGKVKQLKEEKSLREPLCLEISLFSLSTRYPKFKTRAWMGCLHYSKWDDAFRS